MNKCRSKWIWLELKMIKGGQTYNRQWINVYKNTNKYNQQ